MRMGIAFVLMGFAALVCGCSSLSDDKKANSGGVPTPKVGATQNNGLITNQTQYMPAGGATRPQGAQQGPPSNVVPSVMPISHFAPRSRPTTPPACAA
jgi:hypothetical protein